MRIMMNVKMPHAEFNKAVRDGSAGKKLGKILDELRPESAYFTDSDGMRSAVLVVELDDASKIPALAEPWFLTFNADVQIRVVMTAADLQKSGLDAIGKKWA
jgi:hypothetical protein